MEDIAHYNKAHEMFNNFITEGSRRNDSLRVSGQSGKVMQIITRRTCGS